MLGKVTMRTLILTPEYPDSNINQWLNSAASSNWFVKKGRGKDNPPDNVNKFQHGVAPGILV